jgi:hypothetical protein
MNYQPKGISRQPSAVRYQLAAISGKISAGSYQRKDIGKAISPQFLGHS